MHVLGACVKIFNECVSQNCKSQPIVYNYFLILYDPTQFFELSFVGIYQRLIEIWLFTNEFQNRNFGKPQSSGGIKSVNKLFIKFLHCTGIVD